MSPLSYLEINQKALTHNLRQFRQLLPADTKLAAVVKANAYGHGMREVVQGIGPLVDYLQVDDLEELRIVRSVSQKPVLVLGYIQLNDLPEAVQLGCSLAVYDTERLETLNSLGPVAVHLKIDALLGRQGILLEELEDFLNALRNYPNIQLQGVYTHFANIEDTTDFSHAQQQITYLEQALHTVRSYGYKNVLVHISATSGILANPHTYSLARLGIGLYGLWPSADLRVKFESESLRLIPALRWVSHIAQVKDLPAGFPIGYGLTYVTPKSSKIAIIPQGYSDGYDRGLSNCGEVVIQGTRCPVRGRIAMNMFAVDVTHLPRVKAEDEVVLLGEQGKEEITAEELAEKTQTINYEVVARISPLLPRILV